jgi:S-formylglutathione hydrolase
MASPSAAWWCIDVTIETLAEKRSFDGTQGFYSYESTACNGPIRFGVYRPPQAGSGPLPTLFFLAGLTCSEETFAIKAGAQRLAAELGLVLVTPDTSPRDTGIEAATGDWEFGEGAGFWLDATAAPYAGRFAMRSVVERELPTILAEHFGVDLARMGICGHSMGGHGALTMALRSPERWRSVSAIAPITAPSQVPWGQKALPRYLGPDENSWREYDATALIEDGARFPGTILIDQGEEDQFLAVQLRPELFEQACRVANQPLQLRRHAGYDHSYWFIQSVIADHLRHHAESLRVMD